MTAVRIWRSLLFVPANNWKMLNKATSEMQDAVLMDLEDACPPAEKETGRVFARDIVPAFKAKGIDTLVRINSLQNEGVTEEDLRREGYMLISLLQKRRSIREFQEKKVEAEKIDTLIEAALRSPSGGSKNPWEFIVVNDKDILEKLSKAKERGSAFLKGASLGIVICADPSKQDVWIEDAAIASIIIHLTSASLGLGSCWIQIRERMHKGNEPADSYIAEVLGLPKNLKVLSMVAIGYPAEEKPGHGKDELQYDKVHRNRYGGK